MVEDHPHHRTYFPSLVQVPTFTMSGREPVDSCFTLPRGVQASNGAGNEWDDGFFDRVEKIYIRGSDLGCVFAKFDYIKDNTTVAGAGHWNATTLIPELEDNRIVGRGLNQAPKHTRPDLENGEVFFSFDYAQDYSDYFTSSKENAC
ncbi:hypothetical protein Bca52824_090224 [Brassica carinata]|uniref:Jacalin-type lectin domain-containing protein n=1 Tax=Brassica carinata TaxID=52824 RepID=A0A8X7THW0_BRACI|nr:hypothetical protein Bca52824_090224 [Brassica carinata]